MLLISVISSSEEEAVKKRCILKESWNIMAPGKHQAFLPLGGGETEAGKRGRDAAEAMQASSANIYRRYESYLVMRAHSLTTNTVVLLFMCSFVIPVSSLVKGLFKSFVC